LDGKVVGPWEMVPGGVVGVGERWGMEDVKEDEGKRNMFTKLV